MTKLTLEDLESPEAMDRALKKVLVDYVNEIEEIQETDRKNIEELGKLQTELIKECATAVTKRLDKAFDKILEVSG